MVAGCAGSAGSGSGAVEAREVAVETSAGAQVAACGAGGAVAEKASVAGQASAVAGGAVAGEFKPIGRGTGGTGGPVYTGCAVGDAGRAAYPIVVCAGKADGEKPNRPGG